MPPPNEEFMRLALRLARRGLQGVSPNPLVGAVIVKRGQIIGQGYHRRCGGRHAEIAALRDASRAGCDPRGADVYVTLEPCGHHGRTPPCSTALIDAGMARVFYAAPDPNPLTHDRGLRRLEWAGIEVHGGLCEKEARKLNRPFFYWVRTGKPWVILKWAMTLDGRIATAGGESRWITGEAARAHAHGLRRRVDAVLVGTETALRDDPLLNPRPARGRYPVRIVLDRRGRLPLSLRLLGEPSEEVGPADRLYVTSFTVARKRQACLRRCGVEVVGIRSGKNGIPLPRVLDYLGKEGISQLLVEGGAKLLGSFLSRGEAHEAAVYIAPRIAGGARARGAIEGRGIPRLEDTPWLEEPELKRLGRDYLVQGVLGRRR